jgi:hypothetical protein
LAGKPAASVLVNSLPDPIDYGIALMRPSANVLRVWIRTKFKEKAEIFDEEANQRFKESLIAEKVQMLQAHAVAAAELQRMGFNFFQEHPEKITALVALRLVVEGIRIERESVGIPRTLEKLSEKSDEDLIKQIEEALQHSQANFSLLPGEEEVVEEETDVENAV